MSAETLRRAAALMRERAEYAPDAPWTADARSNGMTWVRFGEPKDDISMHGYPAAASHIASWHPAVALAVADWLNSVARAERHEINGADIAAALDVARAYLREQP